MGGNNPETAQGFITYAGCHTNTGKSYLGALIKGLDGELRAPTESENIFYTRLATGVRRETTEDCKEARGRIQEVC
jgi:hypothetical protein